MHPSSAPERRRAALVWPALLILAFETTGVPADPKPGNRLAQESSPYLRQHAHNPVDWYPWGPEAFEKARKQNRPVFLSVGYSACHWCHVMERESFESAEVARLLNEHFVAIKVDREERPDIDEIYMSAVQMIQGSGGWPMSVFLTPEAQPFFGGTYYTRDAFMELLRKVAETWRDAEQRKKLLASAARLAEDLGNLDRRLPGGELTPSLVRGAVRHLLDRVDFQQGGFGGAPKFPPSVKLAFMLERYRAEPDARLKSAILLTLDRMAQGGLFDHVGGGFHRYCVDARWLVPHFEKMLYDNALLAEVYVEASRQFNRPDYARVARATLDFCLRELRAPGQEPAGFWSSLDADSLAPGGGGEPEEGRYYTWTPDEIRRVLGVANGQEFERLFDVSRKGNFEGRSIPNLLEKPLESRAKELKTTPDALRKRADAWMLRLRAERERRPRPRLDDKVLASWNGLMIRSLAAAYDVLGEVRYRRAAESAARYVLDNMRGAASGSRPRPLLHSVREGKGNAVVFLEDYGAVLSGLSRLHAATGESRWLDEGVLLARQMLADFREEGGQVLYATPKQHEKLLARMSHPEDGPTPAPQALAARALLELGRRADAPDLVTAGRGVLSAHTGAMRLYSPAVTGLLLAAHLLFSPREPATAAAAQPGDERRAVPVSVSVPPLPVRPTLGKEFTAVVVFDIGKGWHVNSDRPGENALPTSVELLPGDLKLAGVAYPPGRPFKVPGFEKPLLVWEGRTEVKVRLTLPAVSTAGDFRLRVRYQACNDETCLRPANPVITVNLPPAKADK